MCRFQSCVSQQPRPLTAYWPLAGGQIQLAGKKAALTLPEPALTDLGLMAGGSGAC